MASEDVVLKSQETVTEFDDSDLVTPDEPVAEETSEATAETPEPEPAAETTDEPVAEATETTETTEATTEPEPEPEAKPAPGTPDKALQKVQQRESAIERKLDTLIEAIQAQGKATPEQAAQVQQLQQQHAEVKDELAEILNQKPEDMDFEAAGKGLHVVTKELKALKEALETERREKQELKQSLSSIQQERHWASYESQYPGVAVRDVWKETYASVQQRYGHLGPQAVLQFASDQFHEKAASQVKKATPTPAVTPKPTPKPATTTTHKAAPPTPGGGRVTVKGSQTHKPAATETPEQRYERIAASLLTDD